MIDIKFKGQIESLPGKVGQYVTGLLSESQGHCGQPEPGWYISNSAGMPWAYKVIPQTVTIIKPKKPDSRFTFEKSWCPFEYQECIGPKCEIHTGKGCSIRIITDAAKDIAQYLKTLDRTMTQILGQLKVRK